MDYESSDDCNATLSAMGGLIIWIIREQNRKKDDGETFRDSFATLRKICETFLDRDPPMYTDTLLRAEKICHLCDTESPFGDDVKVQYVYQEAVFLKNEVKELLEDYRVCGPVRGFFRRIGWWVRPPVIDVNMGYRRRYRGAYKLRLKQSEKIGKRLKEMKNETG